jgi:glycine/D-amino acid oxidase-like deaminating enzyme
MIPSILVAKVIEHVAALRPVTSDGLPIFDRIGDYSNALFVGGCGPKGMLLSAGLGFCASQWIANGSCDLSLAPFQLDRFESTAASNKLRSRD